MPEMGFSGLKVIFPSYFLFVQHCHVHLVILGLDVGFGAQSRLLSHSHGTRAGSPTAHGSCSLVESAKDSSAARWGLLVPTGVDLRGYCHGNKQGPLE